MLNQRGRSPCSQNWSSDLILVKLLCQCRSACMSTSIFPYLVSHVMGSHSESLYSQSVSLGVFGTLCWHLSNLREQRCEDLGHFWYSDNGGDVLRGLISASSLATVWQSRMFPRTKKSPLHQSSLTFGIQCKMWCRIQRIRTLNAAEKSLLVHFSCLLSVLQTALYNRKKYNFARMYAPNIRSPLALFLSQLLWKISLGTGQVVYNVFIWASFS